MMGASIGSFLNAFFNKKKAPQTIPYTPVNPQQEQQTAIQGNIASLPNLDTLLSQSNRFQQTQANQLMNSALPGYSQFSQNLLATASKQASNPYAIPQGVVDQLRQYASENAVGGGTGAASGFAGNDLLRSLGINALQYGQTNLNSAMQALSVLTGTAPRVSPMSPLSFMVTPAQQIQNQTYTNTLQQQIAQGGANAQTAAKNWNTQNLWDSIGAGLTYGGASADEAWGQFKSIFGGGGGMAMMGGGG